MDGIAHFVRNNMRDEMSSKGIAQHRGGKSLPEYYGKNIKVSNVAHYQISRLAEKNNTTMKNMVDIIMLFYNRNFILVEQLSLTSNRRIK